MIYFKDKKVYPYYGDYNPLSIYQGSKKIAGWVEKTTDISSNIRIENGYSTMKVKPFGKSEQVQTKQGKNLLDLEELNSSTETWIISAKKLTLTLKPNTQYTCSSNVPAPVDASIDSAIDKPLYFNGNSWNGGAGVCLGKTRTVTTNENGNLFIAVCLNRTYSEELLNGTYYIQIEEGATATEFEPHVPDSPSPNYPSTIENVEGNLKIKVTGKNLFDVNSTPSLNYCETLVQENSIIVTSLSNAHTAVAKFSVDYPLNKPFTISFDATFLEGQDLSNAARVYFRKDNTTYGGLVLTKDANKHTYTAVIDGIPTADYEFWLYIKSSAVEGVVKIQFDNIQVEVDKLATECEAYKKQSVTFPLSEGQKLMKGDYLADDGIHHKRRHFSLAIADMNNSEAYPGWRNLPNLYNDFPGQNAVLSDVTNYCSNVCKSQDKHLCINTTNNGSTMFFKASLGLTQSQWKTQYPDLIVEVEYELAEEEIEAYTEEQQAAWQQIKALKTYRTVTNISNDQDTNMEITYKNNT